MDITYNPIKQTEDYKSKGFFAKIPIPSPGYAIILTGSSSKALVISEHSVPSRNDLRRGAYDKLTNIDIHRNRVSFDDYLPSKDSAYQFHIKIVMNAQVDDPLWVYTNGIRDVAVALKTALRPELHQKSLQYQMDDWKQLQNEILVWLQGLRNNKRRLEDSLRVFSLSEIDVELTQDSKYIAHQEELRKKKAQSDLAEQEHYARIREMKKQEEISNLEHETRLRDMVKQEELAQRGQESGSKIADYLIVNDIDFRLIHGYIKRRRQCEICACGN